MRPRDKRLGGHWIPILHAITLHLLRLLTQLMPVRFHRKEEHRSIPMKINPNKSIIQLFYNRKINLKKTTKNKKNEGNYTELSVNERVSSV